MRSDLMKLQLQSPNVMRSDLMKLQHSSVLRSQIPSTQEQKMLQHRQSPIVMTSAVKMVLHQCFPGVSSNHDVPFLLPLLQPLDPVVSSPPSFCVVSAIETCPHTSREFCHAFCCGDLLGYADFAPPWPEVHRHQPVAHRRPSVHSFLPFALSHPHCYCSTATY